VWQRAMQMITEVYRTSQTFPREEMYGLTPQIRRSAVSVASNIAEGHGRLAGGEYRHLLGVARGSNYELQTQLEVARTLSYGSADAIACCQQLSDEVGRAELAPAFSTT
jgi:four helix bundle protein